MLTAHIHVRIDIIWLKWENFNFAKDWNWVGGLGDESGGLRPPEAKAF